MAQAPPQASPPPQNLQVLPKELSRAEVVAKMQAIAAALGVKCSFCHVAGDFAKDDKDTKGIARRMLRMVDTLNRDNFDGRAEVSCYTCHRGQTKPLREAPKDGPASGGSGGR